MENYRQLRADSFSIRIDFSCCDYVEDRVSKQILSGKEISKTIFFLNYGILTILKKEGNGKLILFNQLTWIKQDRTGDSRSCWVKCMHMMKHSSKY